MSRIKLLDETKIDIARYPTQYVGCLILTYDNQLLLQKRGDDWDHYPGFLCEFGGRIELGELPIQALQRELAEELGAVVVPQHAKLIGAILEEESQFNEIIHTYFWHDVCNTIKGCYEGEPRYFHNASSICKQPNITSGLKWLLNECIQKGLIY